MALRCFTFVWFDRFFLFANAVALLSSFIFLKRVYSAIDLGRRWLLGLRYRWLKKLWQVFVLLYALENAKRLNLSLVDLLWWELSASRESQLFINLLNCFNFLTPHIKRLVLRKLLLWVLQASYLGLLGRVWDCTLEAHLHWLELFFLEHFFAWRCCVKVHRCKLAESMVHDAAVAPCVCLLLVRDWVRCFIRSGVALWRLLHRSKETSHCATGAYVRIITVSQTEVFWSGVVRTVTQKIMSIRCGRF